MDAFYQRFPVAKGEIRLLTVQRIPLVYSFQTARLGNNVPSYKAIPYAWGDVDPARATEIQVCGEGDGEKALLGLWGITRLLRSEFHAHGVVAWETLLQVASQRLVTDSRDKVFAFRSLAVEGRPMPSTDYSANTQPEKVYTDTDTALLCHGESLDLLALAGKARNADSPLPSWVPDHRQFTWNEPFALADGIGCHAGGPFRRLRNSPPGTFCISRLLSKMSLIFGPDIDDQLADEEEYKQYFDEWYHQLMSSASQVDLATIKHNKFFRAIQPWVDT
ncbi:hypothetical protein B0T18DRAFT_387527 [Schizothecium vesticola]|uniref:Uncharacterized protein n=1 Tax=Schizothecium vesticola TaxID=314040 RepID=A0AA40K9V1_9PEZI|nr:hypothetical protein B0T18DRAFT_387527 [Schizothecium vesticola]